MAKNFKTYNLDDREIKAAIVAEYPVGNDYGYTVFRVTGGIRRYCVASNFGSFYTAERWFKSGSDACIYAENVAMQECIGYKIIARLSRDYKRGSGWFNLFLTTRYGQPYLVSFGHPSEGYSREWFKYRSDAISYLERICSR